MTLPMDCNASFCNSGKMVHCQQLLKNEWLRHGSTTRTFNAPDSSRLDDMLAAQVHMGMQSSFLLYAQQKHTSNVGIATREILDNSENRRHYFPATDALVSTMPGVTLAVLTADCAPVFIVDRHTRTVGIAHAGWKGTLERIVEKTVQVIIDTGSRPKDLYAWVGPMAGGCCYEVSPEMITMFEAEFHDIATRGHAIASERYLDLATINAAQLELAGLSKSQIFRSNLCTIHQKDKFYSYRADQGTHGRIISCIGVLPDQKI